MISGISNEGSVPNAKRLLWAGFMAILAAGVGFAIRGGIFDNWSREFGFTGAQLGAIGGAGFTGFCFGIILGGLVADKIGYGKLIIAAFTLHILSAIVTFAAVPGDGGAMAQAAAYQCLVIGMFIFAFANGALEAVANPLIATIFPNNRTHYLNILHASWPAGMILGAFAGWYLDDKMEIHWKYQLALYLIPTVAYGLMFLGQKMPKSEASEKGLGIGEMFKDVGILGALVVCYLLALFSNSILGFDMPTSYTISVVLLLAVGFLTRARTQVPIESLGALAICTLIAAYLQQALGLPKGSTLVIGGALLIGLGSVLRFSIGSVLLFMLFLAHAMVGAVELGTDGWIQNITGNLFSSEQGKYLFLWTSAIMFGLRFCADFIEKKLNFSPVALLFTCAVLAAVGLQMASGMQTFGAALVALGIYAVGKTFFWPTMLAVASDRFPQTGAVAISIMGGIGMLSAGLIGSSGLGYAKDRFSGEALQQADAKLYTEYKAAAPSKFLIFAEANGLDGKKLGEVSGKLDKERKEIEKAGGDITKAIEKLTPDEKTVHTAGIAGDRKTLKADSAIPVGMAVIYLLLMLYFRSIGGYKAVHITTGSGSEPKH